MLVTMPPSTRADTSDTARRPPNEMLMSDISSAGFAPPAANRSCAETGAAGSSGCGASKPPRHRSGDAARRVQEHREQQHAEQQHPILGEARQRLGQADDDGRADHRPVGALGAADNDDQHEQDRLEERERARRDERGRAARRTSRRRPRAPPIRVNASVRIARGLTPIAPAAVSESRTARIASPQPLCASRLYNASATIMSRIAVTAMPRSPIDQPASEGYGTFIRPFWPPVTLSHSTAVNSTTKPKAIVTIAR